MKLHLIFSLIGTVFLAGCTSTPSILEQNLALCDNGFCDYGESLYVSCPQDCRTPTCGNGVCENNPDRVANIETCDTCPKDCTTNCGRVTSECASDKACPNGWFCDLNVNTGVGKCKLRSERCSPTTQICVIGKSK